jgi:hypothetical protein
MPEQPTWQGEARARALRGGSCRAAAWWERTALPVVDVVVADAVDEQRLVVVLVDDHQAQRLVLLRRGRRAPRESARRFPGENRGALLAHCLRSAAVARTSMYCTDTWPVPLSSHTPVSFSL